MKSFIILHPLISEKATNMSSLRKYLFKVAMNATKPEIKKALKEKYNVEATDVNIINVKSKTRRLGQTIGKKSGYKKALITIKEGQTLDVLPH